MNFLSKGCRSKNYRNAAIHAFSIIEILYFITNRVTTLPLFYSNFMLIRLAKSKKLQCSRLKCKVKCVCLKLDSNTFMSSKPSFTI